MRGLEEEERVVVDEYEERCVASSRVLAFLTLRNLIQN
jgi:hypothetical protein